ncbi:sterol desaturase family protein [uncultured Erythrobacter sp.]|uniref:sterol desaturase family protein n=1 Tax=uncultured Erythrobacter sp. TaxID=263913 RepID=UPI0026017FCF|nr:sterol desaturase family protein [uncultured Erythrobacter sp.]
MTTQAATETSFASAFDRVGAHFIDVIYFDGGRYVIAAGVLTLFLFICKTWADNRRIQRKRKASAADYRREILSSGRTILVFAVTTLATLIGREMGIINLKLENAALLTITWQFALIVVVHDAYFYWIHRAMHSKRLFKATHLHHHKSRTPTPWTAYSFSSAEAFFEAAFMPLFLLATSQLGFAYAGFAILFFLWHMIIRNVMAHAGSELFPAGWVDNRLTSWISTTTHHDLHHSSGHNYGFYFTWWDKWMGTEHPRYKEEFRKNAKPIFAAGRLPGSLAERLSVTVMALFAASIALGGPFAGIETGIL